LIDDDRATNPVVSGAERARDLATSAKVVRICGHRVPDGDVLGSQVALAWWFHERGCDVRIVNPDLPARRFDFLSPPVPFEAFDADRESPFEGADLTVLVDLNTLARVGPMESAIDSASASTLVFDHHQPSCEAWWSEAVIDTSAAATGFVVHRWLGSLDAELRPEMATGLFTSIATDTGWFRHPGTSAEVMDVTAELVRSGANPSAIHRALFGRRPAERHRSLADHLSRAELLDGGKIAVLCVPLDVNDVDDASESALDVLRSIESVQVAVLLRELDGGRTRLSLRSVGGLDVHAVAASLGGGGHRNAAGAVVELPLSAAREAVVGALMGEQAA
jgi:phosphoesterase RecJ-like protein